MMLFILYRKNIGVKFFESMTLFINARYSRGSSLKPSDDRPSRRETSYGSCSHPHSSIAMKNGKKMGYNYSWLCLS